MAYKSYNTANLNKIAELTKKSIISNYERLLGEQCLPALCGPWGRFMPHGEHLATWPWLMALPEREDQFPAITPPQIGESNGLQKHS